MISVKRMFCIVGIVIIISSIFMIYSFNEERDRNIYIHQKEVEEIDWIKQTEKDVVTKGEIEFVVTGSTDKDIYKDIYENVITLLNNLKLTFKEVEKVNFDNLNKNSILIFCDDKVENYADYLKLKKFIEDGGKIILAAGLAEGSQDSFMTPILGILEKSVKENYHEFLFKNQLWPLQPEEITYKGYNMSTWIKVNEDATIYIEEKKQHVPILYTNTYKKGKCCVINTTLLSNPESSGLVTGAISTVCEDFLYPVMGVKSIFLDNFPITTHADDLFCTKKYGCITETFIRDTIWTQFQGMGLRNNIMYSSSVLIENTEGDSFPEIQDNLFSTIGKSILKYNGELLFAAYQKEGNKKYYYDEEFLERFHRLFPRYKVSGLVILSDYFEEDMVKVPGEKISVVRNKWKEKDVFRFREKYCCFPEMTSGYEVKEKGFFEICSLHAAYGMLSHSFDMNKMITENGKEATWYKAEKELNFFEGEILDHLTYLLPKTLSQTESFVKSYVNLRYGWRKNEDEIKIEGNNMMKGQTFFYHTNSKIKDAKGVQFQNIGNGYYILKIESNQAILRLARK